MSYTTISRCVTDSEFTARITACVAQENGDTTVIPAALFWDVACAADVEAAYASALEAGNEHPGSDPAVITDQMILSHVQAFVAAHPT
jgi:hypothetical protein